MQAAERQSLRVSKELELHGRPKRSIRHELVAAADIYEPRVLTSPRNGTARSIPQTGPELDRSLKEAGQTVEDLKQQLMALTQPLAEDSSLATAKKQESSFDPVGFMDRIDMTTKLDFRGHYKPSPPVVYEPTTYRPEEHQRPPLGSGYQLSSYTAQGRSLQNCLSGSRQPETFSNLGPNVSGPMANSTKSIADELCFADAHASDHLDAVDKAGMEPHSPEQTGKAKDWNIEIPTSRRERIAMLERAVVSDELERRQRMAKGTVLDLGDVQSAALAPLDKTFEQQWRSKQCQLWAKRNAPRALGQDAIDRPLRPLHNERLITAPCAPPRREDDPMPEWRDAVALKKLEGNQDVLKVAPPPPPICKELAVPSVREEITSFVLCNAAQLVDHVDNLAKRGADAAAWARLATQLCVKMYDLDPTEVLRMVKVLGAAAREFSGTEKAELLRSAETLFGSIACRLKVDRVAQENVDFLTSALEAMGEAGIGNQAYLDLIIAALLSHVRADPHSLAPPRGLRLASALGRILSILRLRPRGCGNAQTSTNMRFIDVLNDCIAATVSECSGESLALLDGHYLARLCGDELRRLLVLQMAKLDLGFRQKTQCYLSALVDKESTLRSELKETWRYSLPREAREYLERLKAKGLNETAPWGRWGDALPFQKTT